MKPAALRLRLPWPGSSQGQVLLALAAALLLAQAISAVLLYQAQAARREEGLVRSVAIRLFNSGYHPGNLPAFGTNFRGGPPPAHENPLFGHDEGPPPLPDDVPVVANNVLTSDPGPRGADVEANFELISRDRRLRDVEKDLRQIYQDQAINPARIFVVDRPFTADAVAQARFAQRERIFAHHPPLPSRVLIAAVQLERKGSWRVARVIAPLDDGDLLAPLLIQTIVIYALLVGAAALILRRITRPLAALTSRLEYFAETRDPHGRLEPSGPTDLRRLILAHNAMEMRVISLLDEKNVMLGAIGHDLKTPLAALRVRIESVEDDNERARMAATNRSYNGKATSGRAASVNEGRRPLRASP